MKMTKKKILILLILSCVFFVGIYIFSVRIHFEPITPIYMALSIILAVIYFVFYYKNARMGYEISLQKREFTKEEKSIFESRRTKEKYVLIFLIPILFSVLGDYFYIVFLSEAPFSDAINAFFI